MYLKSKKMFKFGTVAIIGRPNVGKSTLLNKILGEDLSIISSKPNTTRNSIKGIKTGEDYQIVFLDTPGIHNAKDKINQLMVKQAIDGLSMVDLVYFMVTPDEIFGKEYKFITEILNKVDATKFLLINKVDAHDKKDVVNVANKVFADGTFKFVLPISALESTNVDKLLELTVEHLPEGIKLYESEEITTIPEKFLISEFIRESVFNLLKDEVPYNVVVECEEVEDRNEELLYIAASIIVNRSSQKGIIIGKRGEMLKKIGKYSREKLEAFFGVKVYLELFVKVKEDWMNRDEYLKIQGLI
ncbi:GTPase Era [Deferribacteraceae bacterium V6Fe1]|nr:GTPase Era [Deferribacteraceae bacterium V6Fe1]